MWNFQGIMTYQPVLGPPIFITEEIICKAISQMKKVKATSPSGVTLEIILASQQHIVPHLIKLANYIVTEGKIPEDWNLSHIINSFKGKGDPLVMVNYSSLKLLDHVMKIVEHVVESIIRSSLNINEIRYGFMPGRGTMDSYSYSFFNKCSKSISENISHSILLL